MMTNHKTDPANDSKRTIRIRTLNDIFRTTGIGGKIAITAGIGELGPEARKAILTAVAAFDDFNEDNDPHGEHDFGRLEVEGRTIIWKIDYYDPSYLYGSEDPSDAAVTGRALVVMLASEY